MSQSCIQKIKPGDTLIYRSAYDTNDRTFLVRSVNASSIEVEEGRFDFYTLDKDSKLSIKKIIKKAKK